MVPAEMQLQRHTDSLGSWFSMRANERSRFWTEFYRLDLKSMFVRCQVIKPSPTFAKERELSTQTYYVVDVGYDVLAGPFTDVEEAKLAALLLSLLDAV